MSKHVARFQVTGELISNALALPDNAEVVFIKLEKPGIFTLYVEHPDFPISREGDEAIEIFPIFHCDYDKRPSTWITCEWSLPDER